MPEMWQLTHPDGEPVLKTNDLPEAISAGLQMMHWERNARIVSPTGIRMCLVSASKVAEVIAS